VPFRPILAGFLLAHPSARAVAFCDEEGERVEAQIAPGGPDPYEVDVIAASCAAFAAPLERHGDGARLRILGQDAVVWVKMLKRRYYVVVVADRSRADGRIARALDDVADALLLHM
jgi:hypothetical protein